MSDTAKAVGSIRDRVRAKEDRTFEDVSVPQWGETFRVRSMSGSERAKALENYMGTDGQVDYEALYPELVIATCYDPATDARAFEPADAEWLNTKNAGALELLASAAMRLSGLDREARDRAGKDSSRTRRNGSTSR